MIDNGNHKRTDDIELKFPWGGSIRASGTIVVLLVVLIGIGALLYMQMWKHDVEADLRTDKLLAEQRKTTDGVVDLTCVLTLSNEERIEARRGTTLSKWCYFLNLRDREVPKK